ncbi:PAS domain S-box protein [Halorussus sp. MSC15.2]|uniref:PAS domain S-box protein n=1 Tax=Halorussus sp. MSC15.2 TaxID=2283638 RepID=UPI0013D654FB|nr:PAS domain S-box protein [Halorussus sp. MSC15.2]NEU58177.1 PAS domain S-box protein [Halorussus sp. MSC15.2]
MQSPGYSRSLTPQSQVLYVGDGSHAAVRAIAALREQTTFEVSTVTTATAVLDHLEGGTVSCIVCATPLADMDVLTLLDGVRDVSPDVPFVIVSETDDPDVASAVLAYENTDFVRWDGESYRPRQLARRVENAVDRYRANRTANRTTAYFDALVNQAPDAVLTIDAANRIVFANPAVESVFGYAPGELVGEPLTMLVPEHLRQSHIDAFRRYQGTGERTIDWDYVELPGRHREGHEVPLALSFREVTYDGRRLYSAIVRDVTERKRAEDERRLLHATTRSVAAADTFLDGLEATIAEVCDATEWAYGEAWVPSKDRTHLERTDAAYAVSAAYEPFKRVSKRTSFAAGEGLPGRVWERSDPVWMANVAALTPDVFPRTNEAEDVGLKAALGVPVLDGDDIVAVLAFYMPEAKPTDDRLVDIVTTVATELGELMVRKRAEDQLKREKEFTEGALNALPDIFFTLGLDGRIVRWNDEANAVTGYGDDELDGLAPTELFSDDGAERITDAIERIYDSGSARVEADLRTRDGREIAYEFTGALLRDDEGDPLGIAGIGRDVTDRKRRETQLEASREKYRKLVETAPDAVFLVDAETGTIIDTNDAAEQLLGKRREDIVGMHQTALHPPEETDRYRRLFEAHVESGGVIREYEDYYVVRDDGTEVPVEISASIAEIDGRTINQAVFRDITDRKQYEETLAGLRAVTRDLMAAETKTDICDVAVSTVRDILDLHVCGVHLLDADERVLRPAETTAEAEELFDGVPSFAEGEGLAWRVYGSQTPERYDALPERDDVYNADTPVRTEMILPLGEHGVLTAGSTATEEIPEAKFDLAKILAANTEAALDRADRERTIERQRDQLQAELDEVFERIDDGFFALDAEWRFTYVNEQAERLLGADRSALFDGTVWEVLPEIRETEAYDAFHRAVETQNNVSHEEYVAALDAWFEYHAYPSESGLSVYVRDVSDRKRREQRLERQNERLESFASMLAHELRNPLSIAQIYLPTDGDEDETALERVADALDRMEDMIDILLVMTRGVEASIDPELVSLRETANEAWADVASEGGRLDVETDVQVEVERHHLRHLLQNLLQNAVEHGSEDDSAADDGVTIRIGALEDGFYVEDDGDGIPEADRERVFEAGYTTDDVGIGLGLTFITQLAEIYGWERTLTESDEGGARFEFSNVTVVPAADS